MRKNCGLLAHVAFLGCALAWIGPAVAQEPASIPDAVAEETSWSPQVELHGFGSWAYGNTDGNGYLVGSEDGDYGHSNFALNIAAEPIRDLWIRAQIDLQAADEETEVEFDYGFVEWRFSDALRLRVGQAQQPFGLYAEIFDVGTLRPFLTLPQSIYGPVELVAESYQGAGLTGRLRSGDWEVDYDAYFGGIVLHAGDPLAFLEAEEPEEVEAVRDTIGGRLNITSPIADLSFGVSGFMGEKTEDKSRHKVYAAHVQHLANKLWLRAEAGWLDDDAETAHSGYLEAAYFLTPKWQLASRYEWLDSEPAEEQPRIFDPLFEHREKAIGINYWHSSSLVLKLSFHEVRGNRFARPEDPEAVQQAIEEGSLSHKTRLIAIGAQFSF
jgi:hypothetical protein